VEKEEIHAVRRVFDRKPKFQKSEFIFRMTRFGTEDSSDPKKILKAKFTDLSVGLIGQVDA
jgi:hypothetical protein